MTLEVRVLGVDSALVSEQELPSVLDEMLLMYKLFKHRGSPVLKERQVKKYANAVHMYSRLRPNNELKRRYNFHEINQALSSVEVSFMETNLELLTNMINYCNLIKGGKNPSIKKIDFNAINDSYHWFKNKRPRSMKKSIYKLILQALEGSYPTFIGYWEKQNQQAQQKPEIKSSL